MGPWNQMRRMFAAERVIATTIYLTSLVATLVVAFWVRVKPFRSQGVISDMRMCFFCLDVLLGG